MSDVAAWIGVAVAIAAAGLAWLTYRSQTSRRALEYLVVSTQRLVSPRVAGQLTVAFEGHPVNDPSLTIVRVVSSGDRGIPANTFESPMSVVLEGASRVVSASVSARRPSTLPVVVKCDANRVIIEPLLLNPGDFIEVQALAEGQPSAIFVDSRITDVIPRRRAQLPYPPGSGSEGQMLGMDKFMWTFPMAMLAAIAILGVVAIPELSTLAKAAWVMAVVIVMGVIYPLTVRRLVKRRRAWRP